SPCLSRVIFLILCTSVHRHRHSFPTRRSSDLASCHVPDSSATREATCRQMPRARVSGVTPDGTRLPTRPPHRPARRSRTRTRTRSEEHTSELQSRENLVCRLLLEKKKNKKQKT